MKYMVLAVSFSFMLSSLASAENVDQCVRVYCFKSLGLKNMLFKLTNESKHGKFFPARKLNNRENVYEIDQKSFADSHRFCEIMRWGLEAMNGSAPQVELVGTDAYKLEKIAPWVTIESSRVESFANEKCTKMEKK